MHRTKATSYAGRRGRQFPPYTQGSLSEIDTDYKKQTYDWDRYYEVIHTLQPDAIISNCGPDVRWIGNEGGKVRKSEWSVIPASTVSVDAVMDGSQKEDGKLPEIDSYSEDMGSRELVKQYRDHKWSPGEAEVSVTTGWFYHDNSYYLTNPISIAFSAICTAFVAAPFRILSATTHRLTPLSTVSSLRILPTKTSSLFSAVNGMG